jgi:hypothetical protein
MNVTRIHAGLLAACMCAGAAPASAQQVPFSEKGYVAVSGGFQVGSHDLSGSTTTTIYDEPTTITTQQKVKSAPFFDIGGGYKITKTLAIGVSYNYASSTSDATISGQIPDPLFFDRTRPFTATLSNAKHTENVINLNVAWIDAITNKFSVTVAAGPSIFMVKQDLLSPNVTVTENPFAVQATTSSESKTTAGINLGVDVTYLIGPKWGVGGLARYTWGSVTLPDATQKLTVGGFQIGGGARFLF